ncbi:MucBP domain-containing protein, partial [Lederbergia sp. NSJ-179]|uniref:MucBP domain-containing protein n=1 Tax=Lederbergia sp. NSJ-179 TaxID=2931402 RepID=UPI001FD36FF2
MAAEDESDGVTINSSDFYDYADGVIYQYEGDPSVIASNGGTELKGTIQTDLGYGNGLAMNEEAFFVNDSEGNLYRVDSNGTTSKIGKLWQHTATGATSLDGTKYLYVYDWEGEVWLSSFDINTGETIDHKVVNKTNIELRDHTGDGDIVVDGDGYVWQATYNKNASGNSYLVRIDPDNGDLDRIIPVIYSDGSSVQRLGELAFLGDGTLVGADGESKPYDIIRIDPSTGVVSDIIGEINYDSTDFASNVRSTLQSNLNIAKSVSPEGTVAQGEELTYTLEIWNDGNVASTETFLQDMIPEDTTYVADSTTLNGNPVSDVDGKSPLEEGLYINSPETESGVIFAGESNKAVVTFKVTVNNVEKSTTITNLASVSNSEDVEKDSNTVENVVQVKEGSIVIEYVDEDGNPVADPDSLTGEVGSPYETSPKEIDGYELVKTPDNATGEFKEEEQTVTYVYKPVKPEGTVAVEYVDEDGNPVADPDSLTGEVGSPYETSPKEIDGYELVKTPDNATGEFTEEEQTVTYV